MKLIFNIAICAMLAFTTVAVAGELQTNAAPASASEGLTHEQLERFAPLTKISKNKHQPIN